MSMQRLHATRSATLGAALGAALAVAVHSLYVTRLSGSAPEGAAFVAYALAQLLGFPTNFLRSMIVELPGRQEYHLLLLGIVVNWLLIALVVGYLGQRKS